MAASTTFLHPHQSLRPAPHPVDSPLDHKHRAFHQKNRFRSPLIHRDATLMEFVLLSLPTPAPLGEKDETVCLEVYSNEFGNGHTSYVYALHASHAQMFHRVKNADISLLCGMACPFYTPPPPHVSMGPPECYNPSYLLQNDFISCTVNDRSFRIEIFR